MYYLFVVFCYTTSMRKRAGALVIKNKTLLLISENHQGFYWTPGGGLEEGETYHQALEREIQEELHMRLLGANLFMEIIDDQANETVQYFLAELDELPRPTDTLEIIWYSRKNFEENVIPVSRRIFTKVYPKLLAEGLV